MITPLSEALAERGFETLTAVQSAVTDPEIGDADLLVSAQTGSGKTVGFGLAIAPTILGDEAQFGPAATPLALVVAPTRELAFQVMQELRWLYGKTGAMVNACVGGMDPRMERRALERGTHIVVGTPGRLCDHIRRGSLDLSDVRAVVLDEADEMLDLGFREDLEFILGTAPEERRTLLFSATVSPNIAKLAETYQRDAMRISTIDKTQQHADIAYQALRVAGPDVDNAIFNVLRFHGDESAIVFANTRATVAHLTARLGNRGLSVVSLSGELSQQERSHALQAMRDGRARVCVATDVAARGIDLPNLNLVIHADLPTNTESLLHRSGRTGRAGRKGVSALIVPPKMVRKAENILKWAKITAEWTVPPSAEEIIARDEELMMTDPAWSEPVDDSHAALAARLLETHGAEAVAAAFVRAQMARNAAPEDLLPPDLKTAREPKDFGASRWFSLSVGREGRAEARWLLPMLRRSADLEGRSIGKIRVHEKETHVQIAEEAVAKLEAALGASGEISDGIRVTALEGEPDMRPPPRRRPDADKRGRDGRDDKPRARDDKPARKPRPEREPAPVRDAAPVAVPAPVEAPVAKVPVTAEKGAEATPKRKAPHKERRERDPEVHGAPKPKGKFGGKPSGKSFGKGDGKRDGKPYGKSEGKSFGKRDGKSFGKAEGKPAGKPGDKPRGKPGAMDTSTSFRKRPSDGKPGGKGKSFGKPRAGGSEPPRRGKR